MTSRDLIGLTCPNCGALVPDPGRLAASDQVLCRFCRERFVVDHTAGSRVCFVVPHAAFVAPCRQRIEQLGFRPGNGWTRQSFNGWQTDNKRDALLIGVCAQFGPPFAANHWQSTLTRTWPALIDEIAGARQGQLNALSERGNPVIIVYGQTEYDLRAGLAEAKLDAAAAAKSAMRAEAPTAVAIVAPTPALAAMCQKRVADLGSRAGHASGRDFAGWQFSHASEALLVAVCCQYGPPFAAQHWHDYLGRSWPDLIDTIGQRRSGQVEAKTPQGNRVIILFGQTEQDMPAALAALHW